LVAHCGKSKLAPGSDDITRFTATSRPSGEENQDQSTWAGFASEGARHGRFRQDFGPESAPTKA